MADASPPNLPEIPASDSSLDHNSAMTTGSRDSAITFEQRVDEYVARELFGPRRDQWDDGAWGASVFDSESFFDVLRTHLLECEKFLLKIDTDPTWNLFNPEKWMALPKDYNNTKMKDKILQLGNFDIQWPLAIDYSASTDTFTRFQFLPLEVRRMIWKWALPPSRLVRLEMSVIPTQIRHKVYYEDNNESLGRNMMACSESWDVFNKAYRPIQVFPGSFEEALERQKKTNAEARVAMINNGTYSDIKEYVVEANGLTVVERFDYEQDTLSLSLGSIQEVADSLNHIDLSSVHNLALAGVHVQPAGQELEVHHLWKSLHDRCPRLKTCTALIGDQDLLSSFGLPIVGNHDQYCFLEVGAELSEVGRMAKTSADGNDMRDLINKVSDTRRNIQASFAQEPLMPKKLFIQIALLCRERSADSVWMTKSVEIAPTEYPPFEASFSTSVPVHKCQVKNLVLRFDGDATAWLFPCADDRTLESIYDGMALLFEDFERISLENDADGILKFHKYEEPGPLFPGDRLLRESAMHL